MGEKEIVLEEGVCVIRVDLYKYMAHALVQGQT